MREAAVGPFTTDLSVNEYALARSAGVRPLAQVMGSSVYHVGWQRSPAGWSSQAGSQELTVLSEAWNEARRLASVVLSVRQNGRGTCRGRDAAEDGRARLAAGADRVRRGRDRRPSERDESGETGVVQPTVQEFCSSVRAGYRLSGLCGATAVGYVMTGWAQQRARGLWRVGKPGARRLHARLYDTRSHDGPGQSQAQSRQRRRSCRSRAVIRARKSRTIGEGGHEPTSGDDAHARHGVVEDSTRPGAAAEAGARPERRWG